MPQTRTPPRPPPPRPTPDPVSADLAAFAGLLLAVALVAVPRQEAS